MKRAINANVLTPRQCASILKALGDETRLRILESLLVSEKCVTDLVQELGCSQPHASHHLRILRDSSLVEGHRCGKTGVLQSDARDSACSRKRARTSPGFWLLRIAIS